VNRWTLVSGTSLGLPFIPLLAGADPVYAAASALLAASSLLASVKYRWVSATATGSQRLQRFYPPPEPGAAQAGRLVDP